MSRCTYAKKPLRHLMALTTLSDYCLYYLKNLVGSPVNVFKLGANVHPISQPIANSCKDTIGMNFVFVGSQESHLRPEQNRQSTEPAHEHDSEYTTPSQKEDTPATLTIQRDRHILLELRDSLGCQVIDHTCSSVELLCKRKNRCNT